jgi:transcriptional regulator with XRE-family HTH domain
MTLKEFSARIGIPVPTIAVNETGGAVPTLDRMVQYAKFYDVPLIELYTEASVPNGADTYSKSVN